MESKITYVTQPTLAPLDEYVEYLKGVWDSGILTHNGPLVRKFEKEIAEKIGVNKFVAVTNGTIALQVAIKALGLKGEIITTPFTWIATISAIKWEGCVPVFCDIDPYTLNIDHEKIEGLINENTVGIMPVHVFGNPCDVVAIDSIAKRYNIKVIYDAAHALGSYCDGKSILEYGDISATSLHATKLLNTGEGGGCVTRNDDMYEKLKRIRFFGHDDQKNIVEDGMNAKMTEIHAALGLANLKYYDAVIEDRKKHYLLYKELIGANNKVQYQEIRYGMTNYSYFPVIFKSEEILIRVEKELMKNNIYPRRYFYPSVNVYGELYDYVRVANSEDISRRILCLPLYYGLSDDQISSIVAIIKNII